MDSSLEYLHQQSLLSPEWIQFKEDLSQITRHIGLVNKNLEPDTNIANLIRRLQFLCYELRSQISENETPENKLKILNEFFFSNKKFSCIASHEVDNAPYQSLLLEKALINRSGSPLIITFIYNSLAQHIGLPLYFIDLEPKCFLKYVGDSTTIYIDLSRGGKFLTAEELLENMRRRLKDDKISISQVCETLSPLQFLVSYLSSLKAYMNRHSKLEQLLIIQNSLLDLLPQNLHLLGERALLFYKLKLPRNAILDLKRYFSFQPRERAPQELVRIYDELIGHA
jgi:regulator of sirC expression with transglutaminase-like and TPR domain